MTWLYISGLWKYDRDPLFLYPEEGMSFPAEIGKIMWVVMFYCHSCNFDFITSNNKFCLKVPKLTLLKGIV